MKIRILLLIIICFYFSINSISAKYYNNYELSTIHIEIKWKQYRGDLIYKIFDNKIHRDQWWNKEKVLLYYKNKVKSLDALLKNRKLTKNQLKIFQSFYLILKHWVNEYEEILFNTVQKIKLWESELWESIFWYYKWDPKKWFFWIFSNIHGSYEYGTYQTANYLLKELKGSNHTGWFIIPTINPDGLSYYEKDWKLYPYYLKWRGNINNVDLNRNFCTKNFQLMTFNKNWRYFKSWMEECNSEKETKTVVNVLDTYKFNEIISLHSQGWNFFIPDGSIDDIKIINFWKKVSNILENYSFDISYSNTQEKKQKLLEYEIDEWWKNIFTWTMETYIYEKYNIPVLILELEQHWKIEYDLINIHSLFNG